MYLFLQIATICVFHSAVVFEEQFQRRIAAVMRISSTWTEQVRTFWVPISMGISWGFHPEKHNNVPGSRCIRGNFGRFGWKWCVAFLLLERFHRARWGFFESPDYGKRSTKHGWFGWVEVWLLPFFAFAPQNPQAVHKFWGRIAEQF